MNDEINFRGPLSVGDKIENFSFNYYQDGKFQNGKISNYLEKGNWIILFFYPADFTFICPTELEEMAAFYEKFQKENTEILSISTDTEFTHKAWHDTSESIKKIKFPMVADPTGEISMEMGTYIDNEGLSLRGTFIIDPNGVIKSVEINDNSIGRSATETFRKLQAAQFVDSHDGLVCPASWQPGKDTLKPGEDLVGKI